MAGLPWARLPRLRQLIASKPIVRVLETHNGLTGLIAEAAKVRHPKRRDEILEFDALWSSSLTASASKGLPDIETVDTTARLGVVKDTLAVTSKPLLYDGDTGGLPEIFQFTVRSLENLGVSCVIIEDKTGLKQNSLFGTERKHELESIDRFCEKMIAGQKAKRTEDFMIIARLEALIGGLGLEEALTRAKAYTPHVDGIMIHSKHRDPKEVFQFIEAYNREPDAKPIVVVPTTYNHITEDEFIARGCKVVIYANHMLRAAYPSMKRVAETILVHGRSLETDNNILPVRPMLNLIDSNPVTNFENTGKNFENLVTQSEDPGFKPDSSPEENLDALMSALEENGSGLAVGVPDSLLSSVQVAMENRGEEGIEIAANEGAAVAMATGHYFQTQKVPVVYLQNSGLGNVVNPVMSLSHEGVYGVPMVMLIGWRGAPGHKDEPQHRVMGLKTEDILDAMDVPYYIVPKNAEDIRKTVAKAFDSAVRRGCPIGLLVEPETFPSKGGQPAGTAAFRREDAIEALLSELPEMPIVGSTGFPSRELFEVRAKRGEGHERDFLMVGSWGHGLAIALGVARARPGRRVLCLDGDGASLMHLGTAALTEKTPALGHVVLNNRCHDSVGGQPTAPVDFAKVMAALGYSAHVATSEAELRAAVRAWVDRTEHSQPWFLEVRIDRGTRKDLGRPTIKSKKAKEAFMSYLEASSSGI
jgi:phosphoenolpyruvate phosphomutase